MKRSQFLRSVAAIGVAGSTLPLYSFSDRQEVPQLDKKTRRGIRTGSAWKNG